MKQRGISCKSSNMLVRIKVSNNHPFGCFEALHVSSNMFDICKPNCLICFFIHGFGLSSSTCPKIAHQIWWVPCRRIYIVGSQVIDESWKHRAWTEIVSHHLFGPRGSIVDLINIATLCYCLLSMRLTKARNNTIFFFGIPFGCLCFWPQTLFSFLISVPSKTYMWNFECALREMIWSPLSNPTTWTTSCQPCSKKLWNKLLFLSPLDELTTINHLVSNHSPSWWSDWKQGPFASF